MCDQKSIFLCMLVGAALLLSDVEAQTYILGFTRDDGGNTSEVCTEPGRMCNGCSSVSYCIGLPTGAWIKEEMYSCSDGKTCLKSAKECTDKPNPLCDSNVLNYEFNCYQNGMFPDPFDCTKYHMCVPENETSLVPTQKPMTFKCANGYSYDPLSTLCRNKLVNGTCTPFAQPCTTPGQSGIIAGNPSLYYVCLKSKTTYFPHIFACPFAEKFDGVKCADSTPAASTDAEGKCKDKGYFMDPISCKGYLECTLKGAMPVRRACTVGTKFDYKTMKCVELTC